MVAEPGSPGDGDVAHICATCGTQHAAAVAPPPACRVCLDERQYVGRGGQDWTTPDAIRAEHTARIETVEPGLTGFGMEPQFAIGQRALLVDRLLWDCIPLVNDDIAGAIAAGGGLDAVAISHPHFYSGMVDWAERFDARVLLHEADREWIMRSSRRIELWSGERLDVSPGLELHRLGGHFPGGTVCLWRGGADGRGALLTGDIIQVVSDRDWVSFMWSYPNLIPLPAAEVERIAARAGDLEFDRIYGAWWHAVIDAGAAEKVARSAARYVSAIERYRGSGR